ncbi:hypothetical protein MCOR27_007228 [Pyricularia oryzae]|uniref:AB hydrolase-1 domain-containing protein n=2 Tax=Pyricularia TaxID=48558 RepID=A0ABQ8NY11_PYRGI|nr:hypothetical protein MCOR01_009281 [Pyricularia oryzae]KAI6303761.1 hypothetical protein MCOR33_001111 [Pyricularia grisea]KAH9437470.1 hypothetical protein MCOR02_001128 [Pyricularia oryzae]KAI6261403.1 hypothetical protein MCOR19_002308 [Pyricularia oryzae]KAI6271114.1 hypothetical protein MCOR26_007956 [Pyricularia oryzae]
MRPSSIIALLASGVLALALPQTTGSSPAGVDAMRHSATVASGNTYSYLLSKPAGTPKGTIFLLHGFPDLSYGWRYQMPALTQLGYQVVAPDMLGYGRTSAPKDLGAYTFKKMTDDLAGLAKQIAPGQKIILGGHDWGAAMVYRVALWNPDLVKGLIAVTTPYSAPTAQYVDVADAVKAGLTNFGYQVAMRDPALDAKLQTRDQIRQMLLAFYGAQTPQGQPGFTAEKGLIFENLPTLGSTPLLSAADLDYYVNEYARNTVAAPLHWYRTAKLNWQDEQSLVAAGGKIKVPTLFITATQDTALPASLSVGMEKYFDKLTRGTVDSSHWALWQGAKNVTTQIATFVASV